MIKLVKLHGAYVVLSLGSDMRKRKMMLKRLTNKILVLQEKLLSQPLWLQEMLSVPETCLVHSGECWDRV